MIPIERLFGGMTEDKEAIGTTQLHLVNLYTSLQAQAAAAGLTPENFDKLVSEDSFALGFFAGRAWEAEDTLKTKDAATAAIVARMNVPTGREWFLRLIPIGEKVGMKFVKRMTDRISSLCDMEKKIRQENAAAREAAKQAAAGNDDKTAAA